MMPNREEKVSLIGHNKSILNQLNEYRRSDNLCDVTVVVQGREFRAHRAVLAAGGGFFAGLFAANMKEQAENKVGLNDLDPDAMENVLHYIYTGDIELNTNNAQQIIMAADFLLLEKLKVAVDQYTARVVHDFISTDYLSTYQFARRFKCGSLENAAKKLVLENFEHVCHSAEFLDISVEALEDFISNEDLVVQSEEIVFGAVLYWVKHADERKHLFYQLFSKVRLCSLSEDFLHSSVVVESLFASNPECLKLVMESMKNRGSPTMAHIQHPRACLDTYTNAILVFPRVTSVVRGPWCYIPSDDKWYQIPNPDSDSIDQGFGYGKAVYHDGAMLLIRRSTSSLLLCVDRFDVQTNSWSKLTKVTYEKRCFSVICFQGLIYFIGGKIHRSGEIISSVNTIDVTSAANSVTAVASLNHLRTSPSAVCDQKFIYVLGGIDNNSNHSGFMFNLSVERYDPKLDIWVELAPMEHPSWEETYALVGGKIFKIQGNRPGDYVSNCNEVYDISTDTWSVIPRLPTHMTRRFVVSCDDKLYVIGTADKPPATDEVTGNANSSNTEVLDTFVYNPKTIAWSSPLVIELKKAYYYESTKVTLSGTVVRLPKANIAGFKTLSDASP